MTRLDALLLAAIVLLAATSARPSGLSAPELSDPKVGVVVSGRIYTSEPGSLLSIGGTGIAGLGMWDHPADDTPPSAETPPVPLPPSGLLMVGAIGAWFAMRKAIG